MTTTVNQVVIVFVTLTITLTQYVSRFTTRSMTRSGVQIVILVSMARTTYLTITSYTTKLILGTTIVS